MADQKVTDMPREQISDSTTFGFRPIPDPTVLTTAALVREITNVKEIFQTRLTTTDKIVEQLEKLMDEKLQSIQLQLHERDIRFELAAKDREQALNAALAAAKEAVAQQNQANVSSNLKSEVAFTKQIDQMQMITNAIAKATDEKFDDVKMRLTLAEGRKSGMGESWGVIVAAGGLATGILIAVASYIR